MRIQRLDQDTKKNLLEDLLKRSPNNTALMRKMWLKFWRM